MNNDWQQFLLSHQAIIENQRVIGFGGSREEEHAAFNNVVICDLSHYGLIKASGTDTTDFLQGQLTNDIREVNSEHAQLSAYCSPKGRILCSFTILKTADDGYILQLPIDTLAATLKRLRMYVMRSDVELSDLSDTLIRMGIAGSNSEKLLANHFATLPQEVNDTVHTKDITILKLHGTVPRYELLGEVDVLKSLWEQFKPDVVSIGADSWNLLTIRAGIPEIVTETVEAFVPQMANLHLINGLSFTKGCYPGQEVVARTHYLGKLKRRLYLAKIHTKNLPQPGMGIVNANGNDQKSGKIVSASWATDGIAEILAVIQIESAENAELRLETPDGPALNLLPLPYVIEAN